jgi:uncharacterized protein (TIGR02145 family)
MKIIFGYVCAFFLIFLITFCEKDDKNTIKDVDGNNYTSVTIGTQKWIVENLRTTRYNDGTSIPLVTETTEWSNLTTAGYCWHNNDISNKYTYGALYNWHTVNTGKLCPTGWHVPSDAEWTILENYLITNGYNYDGTTTDNKIAKALSSTTLWTSSEITGAVGNSDFPAKRNATGFTAIPVGIRHPDGSFYLPKSFYSAWWPCSENTSTTAWRWGTGYNLPEINKVDTNKNYGLPVRCVSD